MYHTEPPTDKTIREWYMNSSRVAACALRNEQAVRAYGPMHPRFCRPRATLPPRRAEDFLLTLKNPTASAGFEPANLGTKGQHATSRPPKPL